jgi:hypothetical protein
MAGKSFAIVDIDGKPYPAIVKATGGETNLKTREVPEANVGGTMREEPTGGFSRQPLELEIQEREDEGILIDELHKLFNDWHFEGDRQKRRKTLGITFYSDAAFSKQISRRDFQGAWPKTVGAMEYDRSSDDARTFTVTVTHLNQGNDTKKVGA